MPRKSKISWIFALNVCQVISFILQGPVEADPEYVLIVEANNIAAEMDEEVSNLHKFAKDKYSMRFPELETLVVQPLDYLLTAKELRNNVRLFGFYSSHLISQFLSLSLSHTHTRAHTQTSPSQCGSLTF